MQVRNRRDLWSGIMFLVIGVAFVLFSQAYQMGTPARMGPGFFPTMLGVLLALLGVAIIFQSTLLANEVLHVDPVRWRPLLLVLAAVIAFAVALPRLGMIIAVILLIGISAPASHDFRRFETAASIVVLLAMSWLVFVKGLELQFPVWPVFLGN